MYQFFVCVPVHRHVYVCFYAIIVNSYEVLHLHFVVKTYMYTDLSQSKLVESSMCSVDLCRITK